VGANALIVIPAGADQILAGSTVEAILVGSLETGDNSTAFASTANRTVSR